MPEKVKNWDFLPGLLEAVRANLSEACDVEVTPVFTGGPRDERLERVEVIVRVVLPVPLPH